MRDYAVIGKHIVIGRDGEFEVSTTADCDFEAWLAYINNLPTDAKGRTHLDDFVTVTSIKIGGLEMLKSAVNAVTLLGHRAEMFGQPVPVAKGDVLSMKGRYTGKVPHGHVFGDGFSLCIIIAGVPRS